MPNADLPAAKHPRPHNGGTSGVGLAVAKEFVAAGVLQIALRAINMAHAVQPGMRQQGRGVIVNMASDAGKSANPGESVIGAAMAVIVISRALSPSRKNGTVSGPTL